MSNMNYVFSKVTGYSRGTSLALAPCTGCGGSITNLEVAASKKFLGRSTPPKCKDCFMEAFKWTDEQYANNCNRFIRSGCSLFR